RRLPGLRDGYGDSRDGCTGQTSRSLRNCRKPGPGPAAVRTAAPARTARPAPPCLCRAAPETGSRAAGARASVATVPMHRAATDRVRRSFTPASQKDARNRSSQLADQFVQPVPYVGNGLRRVDDTKTLGNLRGTAQV